MRLILSFSSLIWRRKFFFSSSFSFDFLFFGLSSRSMASTSRWTTRTLSTASFISSIRRRFTASVNSILRMYCDTSTQRAASSGILRLAVLAASRLSLPFGRLLQLLVELLVRCARLADGVDLLLHLLAALVDALVGDLFVVEDDQLADGAVAGVQLIAEVDDLLGRSAACARST